jgi:hypothetical protein
MEKCPPSIISYYHHEREEREEKREKRRERREKIVACAHISFSR